LFLYHYVFPCPLQQLWDKVLEEEAVLLEGAEGSQIAGSKCKEITARDEEGQQPFKKAKGRQQGKYCGEPQSRLGVLTPIRDV